MPAHFHYFSISYALILLPVCVVLSDIFSILARRPFIRFIFFFCRSCHSLFAVSTFHVSTDILRRHAVAVSSPLRPPPPSFTAAVTRRSVEGAERAYETRRHVLPRVQADIHFAHALFLIDIRRFFQAAQPDIKQMIFPVRYLLLIS